MDSMVLRKGFADARFAGRSHVQPCTVPATSPASARVKTWKFAQNVILCTSQHRMRLAPSAAVSTEVIDVTRISELQHEDPEEGKQQASGHNAKGTRQQMLKQPEETSSIAETMDATEPKEMKQATEDTPSPSGVKTAAASDTLSVPSTSQRLSHKTNKLPTRIKARTGKPPPLIRISASQSIGGAAAFLKRSLMSEGSVMVVCDDDDAVWQAFRTMRCARSMLIEDERTTPVFQPVLMHEARNGLPSGTVVFYTHKIMNGAFKVSTTMRVSSSSRVEYIASAIVNRIKEKGNCVLESFGKVPAVTTIKAIELARRRMLNERLDVAVAMDPVLVEVDREDIGATMMNRFVLLECAARDPTNLRVKVNMKLRSSDA